MDQQAEIDDCKRRYKTICDIIGEDKDASDLLRSLAHSASDYVSMVVRTEIAAKMMHYEDCENYHFDNLKDRQKLVQSMDESRRIYHEALISNLNIFNRYLRNNFSDSPTGGIFTLSPSSINNRYAVSEWAGHFTLALKQLNTPSK